jgi:hypothetical protein
MTDQNRYTARDQYGANAMPGTYTKGGALLNLTVMSGTVDIAVTASAYKNLLIVPFYTGRNTNVFINLNIDERCNDGLGGAGNFVGFVVIDDHRHYDFGAALNAAGVVTFPIVSHFISVTAHSSNDGDNQQMSAYFHTNALLEGYHELLVVGRTAGNFTLNALTEIWNHGVQVIIEEYG